MGGLTARDEEILDTLTRRVRVLTLRQIARTWWLTSVRPEEAARDRLQILRRDGLLQIQTAPAHPELLLESPVVTWKPTDRDPDFGAISYRLKSRWKEHPISTVCVSSTRNAANRFHGHGGRFPRPVERTHDIHLARVYLIYRRLSPVSFQDGLLRSSSVHVSAETRSPYQMFSSRTATG